MSETDEATTEATTEAEAPEEAKEEAPSWNGEVDSLGELAWFQALDEPTQAAVREGHVAKLTAYEKGYQPKFQASSDAMKQAEAMMASADRKLRDAHQLFYADHDEDPRLAQQTTQIEELLAQVQGFEKADADRLVAIEAKETATREAAIDELEGWLETNAAWILGTGDDTVLLEKWVALRRVGYTDEEAATALERFRDARPAKKPVPKDIALASADSSSRARRPTSRRDVEEFDTAFKRLMNDSR